MNNSISPKVQVLLSTYNGEKYVLEQLESLRLQDYDNFTVKIRDDGSKDETFTLVSEYIKNNKLNWEINKGENLGVVRSFFWLLFNSSEEADFYSFCDQDDVWRRDKISIAVKMLTEEKEEKPLLYCSAYSLVDEELKAFSNQYNVSKIVPSFKGALFANIATGCTIVINSKARELIICRRLPNCMVHDWWFYLVISAFGKVIFDSQRTVMYRMHGKNVYGARKSLFKNIHKFYRMLLSKLSNVNRMKEAADQVAEFVNNYSAEIQNSHLQDIGLFLDRSIMNRLRVFIDNDFWIKSSVNNSHRIRFLFNSL
jgi:glycosyltransferase involved in cell wall biosynthesis